MSKMDEYLKSTQTPTDLCKEIDQLREQLDNERKLNEHIKVRFVKCNTCTQDKKDKCLMFSEGMCEGERCDELVDLYSLISKQTAVHLKTGNTYDVITDKGIDCTNDRDGTRTVVYKHDDKIFVREYEEFIKKFTFN